MTDNSRSNFFTVREVNGYYLANTKKCLENSRLIKQGQQA